MSFGGSSGYPNTRPKPLGIVEDKLSSNEQAKPVPYVAGKQRLAVTFISDTFDIRKTGGSRAASSKKPTRDVTSYYFSFAALIGHGPIDGIHSIILNNEIVWSGDLVRDGSNPDYVDLTIEDYGLIRIYWGTETQVKDDYLEYHRILGTIPDHPAYRGFAYIVAHRLFAGYNQTNIQNFEVVVSRYPAFGLSPARIGNDANAINIIADLLTNKRIGKGIDSELLNLELMEASGSRLYEEGLGVSPVITSQSSALETVQRLLEYIDGYPVIGDDGRLGIGLVRPVLDQSALPTVDESVLIDPLKIDPEDWSSTFNELHVKFSNPAQYYDPDARTWRDRGNFSITGESNVQTVERPWVTSPAVADFMSKALGRMRAMPEAKGSLKLRMTALFDSLAPGALFKLDYPPRGYSGLVCRVLERSIPDPARPSYDVSFRIDRTYLVNSLSVGTDEPVEEPNFTAASIANFRIVELPVALSPEGKPSLAVLASRPENEGSGYTVHLGKNYDETGEVAAESYEVASSSQHFAWRGVLLDELSASEPLIDDQRGLQIQLTGPDTELDDATIYDGLSNELLAFVNGEIFSISGTRVTGENSYQLSVVRARYGSPQQAHSIGDEVFITRRNWIDPIQHPSFQPYNTAVLKIQGYNGQASSALEDETEIDVQIEGTVYTQVPVLNLKVNGEIYNPEYTTGGTVLIEWSVGEDVEVPQTNVLFGQGPPEGVVTGSVGQFYKDTGTGDLWVKRTGEQTNTGWI